MSESIHELFAKVRKHPEYAGGTIFIREDIAEALFEPEGGWGSGPTDEDVAKVTEEMRKQAISIIGAFIFEGAYSWADALRDNIVRPDGTLHDEEPSDT